MIVEKSAAAYGAFFMSSRGCNRVSDRGQIRRVWGTSQTLVRQAVRGKLLLKMRGDQGCRRKLHLCLKADSRKSRMRQAGHPFTGNKQESQSYAQIVCKATIVWMADILRWPDFRADTWISCTNGSSKTSTLGVPPQALGSKNGPKKWDHVCWLSGRWHSHAWRSTFQRAMAQPLGEADCSPDCRAKNPGA